MKYLYSLVHNYGITIILFTIFSKIVLLPVSILVQKNSVKLVSLKPKINRIKIDYYGDEDKITELENSLYKKEKYNPFLSVIPLFLQIIILMSLVTIVNNPITYITNIDKTTRNSLVKKVEGAKYEELEVIKQVKEGKIQNKELKQMNLKFMNYDLSLVSSEIHNYLFPILAALSALIYCFIEMKINVLQREQSIIYNIITISISVLLSLYLGLYVPRGVALYWIFSNLFAIIQLFLLNIIINPKKYVDYAELERTNKELSKLSFEDRDKDIIRKEKEDYKKFLKIENKHLVIYAEDGGYYKFFKGIIEYLLEHTNIIIHYITSDYYDDVFKMNISNFKTYYIGEKKLISLMMRMDSDIVLMTVPDLDNFHIKRSYVRKDIEYIFVHHGIGSYNLECRKGSLDHFDTIFAYGKSQKEEILKGNELYKLNRKVVEFGYPLLEEMITNYKKKNDKTIIIAPSWQKDNIMESCINDIIDVLSKKYKIILRAHPYFIKRKKNEYLKIKDQYKDNKNVIIQDDYTTNNNILNSELLITDWSGIGCEYALTTKKPTLYINTPIKETNKEYKELGIEPINIWSRDIIGKSVNIEEIKNLDIIIADIIKNKKQYEKKITEFLNDNVYNLGKSSEIGADYIISVINKKIERRKHD